MYGCREEGVSSKECVVRIGFESDQPTTTRRREVVVVVSRERGRNVREGEEFLVAVFSHLRQGKGRARDINGAARMEERG